MSYCSVKLSVKGNEYYNNKEQRKRKPFFKYYYLDNSRESC